MGRFLILVYGVVSYGIGVAGLLAIIFHSVGVMRFEPGLGTFENPIANFAMCLFLVGLFGLQHTVMARQSFKDEWTKHFPIAMERPTFVLVTGVLALGMSWLWPSMETIVWQAKSEALSLGITVLGIAGWAYLFAASFAINHFELFGLQQVYLNFRGQAPKPVAFKERLMYKFDRHPIMTGVLVGLWATPIMRLDHLMFSLLFTLYVIVGVSIEEKSLLSHIGAPYEDYKKRVRSVVPMVRL